VEDGGIIVLGGLLKDGYSDGEQKVPVLGDVPVLGNLFKSQTRSRAKRNLMVFLRPVVLRDGAQTDALSMDRYDLMRASQQGSQPPNSVVTPINQGPVLPSLRAVQPPPAGSAAPQPAPVRTP